MAGHMLGVTRPAAAYAAGGFTNTTASAVGEKLGSSGYWIDGGSKQGSVVSLGGVTFSPNVTVNGGASREDVMEALRAAKAEFADFIDELMDEMEEVDLGA